MKFSVATSLLFLVAIVALFQVTECQPINGSGQLTSHAVGSTASKPGNGNNDGEITESERRKREEERKIREGMECIGNGRWVPCPGDGSTGNEDGENSESERRKREEERKNRERKECIGNGRWGPCP
ncbi:hypothetical protein BKA69DRAFT_304992 [Paraphysoderma sedebokerense]|nr:hypothetical protein BKA69DRAFT_304992 [Paraphysoderma sedebokerense]